VRLRAIAHRLQDRFLATFGRSPADRSTVVRTMLQPHDGEVAGYWLQLVIATMLATLGLALNSSAVVIGAMLIAPLMRPIVELAMGFATGSAGLVLRAAVRTVASIGVATLVAFAITWVLPFHEITTELQARTAPSLLDLAVAAACALAAGYASLRADTDIATTAAGTSIGISLVPPLCAAGYGLAIHDEAEGIDTSRVPGAPQTERIAAAPSVPPPQPRDWYYLLGQERFGPLDLARLKELWQNSHIGPDTLVWTKDMKDWLRVEDVPELLKALRG